MKKRLLLLLLCVIFTCTCFGCGNGQNADDSYIEEEDSFAKHEKNKKDIKDIKGGGDDIDQIDPTPVVEEIVLPDVLIADDKSISVLRNGEELNICSLSDEEYRQIYYAYRELVGDYVIVVLYSHNSIGHTPILQIYDMAGKQVVEFALEKDASGFAFEKLHDDICISYYIYDGAGYGADSTYKVYTYTPGKKSIEYDEKLTKIYTDAKKLGYIFPTYEDTVFKALGSDSDSLYAWDPNNRDFVILDASTLEETGRSHLKIDTDYAFCESFQGDYAVVYVSSGDYPNYVDHYYLADMNTGEADELISGDIRIMEVNDGKIYFYEMGEDNYLLKTMDVYSLDVYTKEKKKLYSTQVTPSCNYAGIYPGVSGFNVKGDVALFQYADDGGYYWSVYDLKKGTMLEPKYAYKEYEFARYATIDAVDGEYTAGEKETVYFSKYIAKVSLLPTIKNADKINASLEEYFEAKDEIAQRISEDSLDWLTSQQEAGDDYFTPSSYDSCLCDITAFGSRYLQLSFETYEYSGGAHGYGYYSYLLFDLETGERTYLSDVCGVDFDTFKQILIEKSIEDLKTHEGYYYYYDDEDMGESQFRSVLEEDIDDFDLYPVEYTADGINVIYQAYQYGPYVAGDHYIFISYDELGMDLYAN